MSFYLAVIYKLFGFYPLVARLITALLGTGVVGLIYLIGRKLFSEPVALLAAAIAAGYTYLIFYSVTLVTETPFMLCLLLAIYLAMLLKEKRDDKRLWLLLGLCLAVTLLLRMAVVFFIPFLLWWIIWPWPRQLQAGWYWVGLPVLIIILALLPFTIRNYQMWGHFMLLEAQFGHVFWNGNHPDHEGDYQPTIAFEIPATVLASGNDAQITADLLQLGLANVAADPAHFINLTGDRLRELFTFWPTRTSILPANIMRLISFGWVAPLAAIGLWLSRRHWRQLMPVYLFLGLHTGVYAISWAMIRYRIPMDAFFILFAAYALYAAYAQWQERRRPAAAGS